MTEIAALPPTTLEQLDEDFLPRLIIILAVPCGFFALLQGIFFEDVSYAVQRSMFVVFELIIFAKILRWNLALLPSLSSAPAIQTMAAVILAGMATGALRPALNFVLIQLAALNAAVTPSADLSGAEAGLGFSMQPDSEDQDNDERGV